METAAKDVKQYGLITSEMDAEYHQAAFQMGLSDSALRILYVICLHGEESMLSEIVRLTGMQKQTVHSSLRKMEEEGLLRLLAAEGRRKKVCLTESGKELTRRSVLPLLQIEQDILSSWTQEEQDIYIQLNHRFLVQLREKMRTADFGGAV